MCLTTLFWLALLGAFLLGLLLGWWIWGKYKSWVADAERKRDDYREKLEDLRKEHDDCKAEISSWKSKHDHVSSVHEKCNDSGSEWKAKYDSLQREHSGCAAKITAAAGTAAVASSFAASTTAAAKPSKPDDLKKVEGIGPKIAEILNSHGVKTWAQLADTDPTQIKQWLEAAGPRYKMHKPGSWPKQARMAADGKWDELIKWQDEHKGGVE